ncbi:MAG: hypothetical protein CVU55_14870 [Deltaproteobacteria bacterium HGW-Deltaproteobacteria-13]|jgi:prepilin-type N-terminal cleavage/methylation domain-containing protein|nr:MAG: hypothetical protein CVU55_14870 [Deltaproteobacteria bacterium HGW-Deltaproteobacteria-13]
MRKSKKGNPVSVTGIICRCSGFTLIELTIALVVMGIIVTLAFSFYKDSISKAKITVAQSVLVNVKKTLAIYNMDKGNYPASIDFTSCLDEKDHPVFGPELCAQLKEDVLTENYSGNASSFELKARAKDTQKTLITLTQDNITIQGH